MSFHVGIEPFSGGYSHREDPVGCSREWVENHRLREVHPLLFVILTVLRKAGWLPIALLILAQGLGTGCQSPKRVTPTKRTPSANVAPANSSAKVGITDVEPGHGEPAVKGKRVVVEYTARLSRGPKVDSTRDKGKPARFVVGRGTVIAGLELGVIGMRPGGKRRLVVPPELAYGQRGVGDVVPPGSELTYDVELIAVLEDAEATTAGTTHSGAGGGNGTK